MPAGNPTRSAVHVNTPLTNVSIAFMQKADGFVADKVFPNVPVTEQSNLYYTYEREDFNRDEMQLRAPGTESAGGGFNLSTDPYFAHVYAFHKDLDDQTLANADSVLQLDKATTQFLANKALIKRERTWVDSFFTTSKWGTDITGVDSTPSGNQTLRWNVDNSTPIEDIRSYMTRVQIACGGYRPNTLVLGRQVADVLIDHPDIVARIDNGQTPGGAANVTLNDLANLFKIQRVMVMDAIYNSAVEGATESNAFIGGKNALLCYSAPNPGLMVPTGGYTFSWTGLHGAGNMGQRIKRFRMEAIESDRIEIQMAYDQKLVAPEMGLFMSTIVA